MQIVFTLLGIGSLCIFSCAEFFSSFNSIFLICAAIMVIIFALLMASAPMYFTTISKCIDVFTYKLPFSKTRVIDFLNISRIRQNYVSTHIEFFGSSDKLHFFTPTTRFRNLMDLFVMKAKQKSAQKIMSHYDENGLNLIPSIIQLNSFFIITILMVLLSITFWSDTLPHTSYWGESSGVWKIIGPCFSLYLANITFDLARCYKLGISINKSGMHRRGSKSYIPWKDIKHVQRRKTVFHDDVNFILKSGSIVRFRAVIIVNDVFGLMYLRSKVMYFE